jgi:hypothetical protein
MGWLTIKTVSAVDGATPVGATSMSAKLVGMPMRSDTTVPGTTDAQGEWTLYNVLATANAGEFITGSRPSQVDSFGVQQDHGFYKSMTWSCAVNCVGAAHPVIVLMAPEFLLQGQLEDILPPAGFGPYERVGNISVHAAQGSVLSWTAGQSQLDGTFKIDSFPAAEISATPAIPFSGLFEMQGGATVPGTIMTTVTDSYNGTGPVPHAVIDWPIVDALGRYSTVTNTTDASGQASMTASFLYDQQLTYTLQCSDWNTTALKDLNCHVISNDGQFQIKTNISYPEPNGEDGIHGWRVIGGMTAVPYGQTTVTGFGAALLNYLVQGTVTDAATNQVIANATITDLNGGSAPFTTDNSGGYSGWFNMPWGSWPIQRPYPYQVNLSVSAPGYITQTLTLGMPTPVDPTVNPIIENVSLSQAGGAGGI